MPLIDPSYLIGELNISNADKPEVNESLLRFISKYEARFLKELLGFQLYSDFTTGLTATPVLSQWSSLKDGSSYTYNQRTYKWEGLIRPDTKESPIANYVYYWYMRNNATESTGIGEVVNKAENATRVSPNVKMCRAWNEMVNEVWKLVSFLDVHSTDYPNWSWYGDTSTNYWMGYNHARLKEVFYPINTFNL